jgi:hypothetical protein
MDFKKASICLFLATSYYAGTNLTAQSLQIGSGLNFCDLEYNILKFGKEEPVYQAPRLSWSASLGIDYLKKGKFRLKTQLVFAQISGKHVEEDFNFILYPDFYKAYPDKASMGYLSLSQRAYFSPHAKRLRIDFFAGIRVDRAISGLKSRPYELLYLSHGLYDFNFGMDSGLGVAWQFKGFALGFEFNYPLRIFPIAEIDPAYINGAYFLGSYVKDFSLNTQIIAEYAF